MKAIVLSLLVLVTLMTAIPSARASTQQPFKAMLVTPEAPMDCDRIWVDGGVFHARGCEQTGTITGDMSGTMVLTVNLDLRASGEGGPQDGTAQVKGNITLEGGNDVSYTMSANALFQEGVLNGNIVILGVGTFKGTFIIGKLIGIADGFVKVAGTMLTTNA